MDTTKVAETGVGGRIRKQDVLQAAQALEKKAASLLPAGERVPVSMPQLNLPQPGESLDNGTVTRWLVREGDRVEVDQPLLEVSTDKVDTEVPSPAAGILRDIAVDVDETVAPGTQLAIIETDPAEDPSRSPVSHPAESRSVSWASVRPYVTPLAPQPPAEVPVYMPQFGESTTEVTVTIWLAREGDHVEVDQPLLEVSTEMLSFELPSPAAGILRDIVVFEHETVAPGTQLAIIKTDGGDRSGRAG